MGSEKRRVTLLLLRVGQVEFPAAIETYPICPVFNSENTAEVTVPAPKDKLEDTQE
jgi:hypothetical protein